MKSASLTSLMSQKLRTCDVFWCVLVAFFESLNLQFWTVSSMNLHHIPSQLQSLMMPLEADN